MLERFMECFVFCLVTQSSVKLVLILWCYSRFSRECRQAEFTEVVISVSALGLNIYQGLQSLSALSARARYSCGGTSGGKGTSFFLLRQPPLRTLGWVLGGGIWWWVLEQGRGLGLPHVNGKQRLD